MNLHHQSDNRPVLNGEGATLPTSELLSTSRGTHSIRRVVRPFRMHAITVRGKYLNHDEIMTVVSYFLVEHREYLASALRENMAALTALGHQFTEEDWAKTLDESMRDGMANERRSHVA